MNTAELGARSGGSWTPGSSTRRAPCCAWTRPPAAATPASEFTTAQELQHYTQIEAQLAPSNDPKYRRSAIDRLFLAMVGPARAGKIIDPDCIGLIQGYSPAASTTSAAARWSP
jgi:hypothetical protein